MQNIFLHSIIVALLLFSFHPEKRPVNTISPETASVISSLDTGKWYLKIIYPGPGAIEVKVRKAFIKLDPDNESAGGNGSCNSFRSTMKVDGKSISFANTISTKMYCENVQSIENSFFSQLHKVTRYEEKKNELLLFAGDKVVLEFEK